VRFCRDWMWMLFIQSDILVYCVKLPLWWGYRCYRTGTISKTSRGARGFLFMGRTNTGLSSRWPLFVSHVRRKAHVDVPRCLRQHNAALCGFVLCFVNATLLMQLCFMKLCFTQHYFMQLCFTQPCFMQLCFTQLCFQQLCFTQLCFQQLYFQQLYFQQLCS